MDIGFLSDWIAHADERLGGWMQTYGLWVYAVLFLIVFLETNVVFGGPLPGDTLAVACGILTATGHLSGWLVVSVNMAATISGYFFNYALGYAVRRYWIKDAHPGFMRRPVIQKAEDFFRQHARAAVLFARFIPFMRSIAPLVAGMGRMPFKDYAAFSTLGGVLWAGVYFVIGYFVTDMTVLSGRLWLIPPAVLLLFVPAWLVNYYFQRRRARKQNGLVHGDGEGV